jgi:PKD repeat protein/glucose/arabinose dehydrogenase
MLLRAYLVSALVLVAMQGAHAQVVPSGFVEQAMVTGLNAPVGMTWDANGRGYLWEKAGRVWIVENGVRLPQPLLDISEEVGDWRDHGCLGFTLDPDFLNNGRVYLMYLVDRHHLMNFGTPSYNPATNEYNAATIARITRYTATGPSYLSVDPASRFVLLGEVPGAGPASLHESHSNGTLVFGRDGTLLASMGDGASYSSIDVGNAPESYATQALADGIIRPEENVGAFRSQMLNSFNGKVLRLDPETGDGVPSNPWFDPADPRSPRSRSWALGLRNPFRMTLEPGTGSSDPAAADPGVLYIGDVGYQFWEEVSVCDRGGLNFGWPLWEGLEPHPAYTASLTPNRDAPNPLFNGVTCTQQYFHFQDLLKQVPPASIGTHPNPCDPSQQIPLSIFPTTHARPIIDWFHGNRSRCGAFDGMQGITFDLDDPLSPVTGPRFGGFCAIGGPYMEGNAFPEEYRRSSFHGDFAQGWVRRIKCDEQRRPVSVHNFATGLGALVWLGAGPDDCLWYIKINTNELRRICYGSPIALPPVAVATQDVQYGPGPLFVNFNGAGSYDPAGGTLTYLWDFGNGFTSTLVNPSRIYSPPPGVLTNYTVVLTVTNGQGLSNTDTLLVSVNNTPPVVQITSFADGATYPLGVDSLFTLEALVTDAEHGPNELTYAWQTTLHVNGQTYPGPWDSDLVSSMTTGGAGCEAEQVHYSVSLTATDAGGLSTTVVHHLLPRCAEVPPIAVILASSAFGDGPLEVQMDGSSSYGQSAIVGHVWDFGDGTFSTEVQPVKTFSQIGPYQVTLTVTDANGLTGMANRVITVLDPAPPPCPGQIGSITREYFAGIPGGRVSDLLNSPAFPDQPTSVNFITSLQGPVNLANNYGTRVRGYLVPPATGTYVFTATSDDACIVFLSPNADPGFKQPICSVPDWTGQNQLNKYPSQVSPPMELVAGRYYYVEFLHKEAAGGDHFTLWWQTPSNAVHAVVPGSALARWEDCSPSVRVRATLKGPWNAAEGLMRDDLRVQALLPLTEPFTDLGFTVTDGGETIAPARLEVEGMNAAVDWVLVELRSAVDPAQIVATRAAILERDGDVVGADGYQRLRFNVAPGAYHVAVRHRNHLGAMTAAPVLLGANEALVDLTWPATATFGTQAQSTLTNGRKALWSGNVLRDGVLLYTGANNDRDPILQAIGGSTILNSVSGYLQADVDMNGVVRYVGNPNDRDPILQNVGGSTPTGQVFEQLP